MSMFISLGFLNTLSKTINHDVAWYLYTAKEFLDGGTLYQNIFWEPNFPLTLYLTLPPAYLAQITNLSAINLFIFYIFCLISLSLFLTWILLIRFPNLPSLGCHGLLLSSAFALIVSPGTDFGQREHITVILCLPYIVLIILRLKKGPCPWPLGIFVGLIAAIGFAVKPQFLFIPIILEFYRWTQRRCVSEMLQYETVTFVFVSAIYGMTLLFVNSEYFTTVLPYALKLYNVAYQSTFLVTLVQPETILLPLVGFLHFKYRITQRHEPFTDIFLLTALGFYLIYLIQMKGWHYQVYPVLPFLILALISMMIRETQRGSIPDIFHWTKRKNNQKSWVLVALLLCALFTPSLKSTYENSLMVQMIPIVKKYAAGSSIFTFSSSLHTAFPLVNYTNVDWASRFPTLWLLPGLIHLQQDVSPNQSNRDLAQLEEIEQFVINSVVSDLSKKQPAIILVDVQQRKRFFGEHAFDYLKFFSSDPKFLAIWSHYKKINDLDGFQVFLRTST